MLSPFPQHIFVSGIGTGVGKTITSTILCKALHADYWKPIQTGGITDSDSRFVQQHAGFDITIHPETYLLQEPASPHYAAFAEGTIIDVKKIIIPPTKNRLVIEGAGGLLVPLNHQHTMIDLIGMFNVSVILVANEYLGSINHTLLSIEALRQRKLPLLGIIFNGERYRDNEEIILKISGSRYLGRVEHTDNTDMSFFAEQSVLLQKQLSYYFNL